MQERHAYVQWFRNSAPYINTHRGRTFVIQLGGEAVLDAAFPALIHDFALLDSLGVRLVLVHGARPQVEARLHAAGLTTERADGLRVTTKEALPLVAEASAAVRVQIEALLTMGLANSPMAGARLRTMSGNFVIARPLGVRDGVDFRHTGEVRRIDAPAMRTGLEGGAIIVVSPVGFSPTGELLNLRAEDVAAAIAIELHAAKLMFLTEDPELTGEAGTFPRELTLAEAKHMLNERRHGSSAQDEATRLLDKAVQACRNGVSRSHLLDRRLDGALLLELFTRDGVGTMVNADRYDSTRRATIEDVGGILELIEPLESHGVLVPRSRETLQTDIDSFHVVERDGAIVACAALHAYPATNAVELACLAVSGRYRNAGRGDALLAAIEREARGLGAERVLVLTTQAVHWFRERGFEEADLHDLPPERREKYSKERNSKVMVKRIVTRDA